METTAFAILVGTVMLTSVIVAPEKVIEGYRKGDFKRAIKLFFTEDFFGIGGK